MDGRRKLRLGGAVLTFALAFAMLLVAGNIRSRELRADDGSTTEAVRGAAESAIARLDASVLTSWRQAREPLRVSMLKLAEQPYVANVWLVRASGAGRISYSSGGTGRIGDDIVELAGVVGEAATASEVWASGGTERYIPIAAAAMSADGDHRDVFRYMAVPVTFADGDGALVAVTYDRTPAVSSPSFFYQVLLGAAGALALLASFLVLTAVWKRAPAVA